MQHLFPEEVMKNKDLKKILAGIGAAGLISACSYTIPATHAAGSG